MTSFIQAKSVPIREIRGRLVRKVRRFRLIQSNSNHFKPKKCENRSPIRVYSRDSRVLFRAKHLRFCSRFQVVCIASVPVASRMTSYDQL